MAAVGTGPIITTYGYDLAHIGRTPQWQVYEVDGQAWDFSAEPNETGVLRSLPIGTVLVDAVVVCTKAASATGKDILTIQTSDDRAIVTPSGDDIGGVIDVKDIATVVDGSAFPTTVALDLEVLRAIDADTGTTLEHGAHYRVAVLLCRPEMDR
jgi:hypothetical protein